MRGNPDWGAGRSVEGGCANVSRGPEHFQPTGKAPNLHTLACGRHEGRGERGERKDIRAEGLLLEMEGAIRELEGTSAHLPKELKNKEALREQVREAMAGRSTGRQANQPDGCRGSADEASGDNARLQCRQWSQRWRLRGKWVATAVDVVDEAHDHARLIPMRLPAIADDPTPVIPAKNRRDHH